MAPLTPHPNISVHLPVSDYNHLNIVRIIPGSVDPHLLITGRGVGWEGWGGTFLGHMTPSGSNKRWCFCPGFHFGPLSKEPVSRDALQSLGRTPAFTLQPPPHPHRCLGPPSLGSQSLNQPLSHPLNQKQSGFNSGCLSVPGLAQQQDTGTGTGWRMLQGTRFSMHCLLSRLLFFYFCFSRQTSDGGIGIQGLFWVHWTEVVFSDS